MKRAYLIFILIVFLFFSCIGEKKEVKIRYSNGEPQEVEYFHYEGNEKIVSKRVYYYPSGIKESEIELKDGKKHGKVKYYYNNGEKKLVEHYKNGKLNGRSIKYYRSGKYSYEASWKDDLPHGKWIYYDQNGKKTSEQEFKNGKLIK